MKHLLERIDLHRLIKYDFYVHIEKRSNDKLINVDVTFEIMSLMIKYIVNNTSKLIGNLITNSR